MIKSNIKKKIVLAFRWWFCIFGCVKCAKSHGKRADSHTFLCPVKDSCCSFSDCCEFGTVFVVYYRNESAFLSSGINS